jgi:ketosteroid isomerase-like protein
MKKFILFLISIVGITLGLNNCKNTPQNSFTEADKEAITNTSTGAVKVLNENKDIRAYVNTYYAEDATVLMPNSEPVKGREAIIGVFQSSFGDSNMDIVINDINGEGDLAYVYGNYNEELQPGGVKDNGKYIEIWRKQADGKWQAMYDIWNTSVPIQIDTTKTKK